MESKKKMWIEIVKKHIYYKTLGLIKLFIFSYPIIDSFK